MPRVKHPLNDVVAAWESEQLSKEIGNEFWEHLIAFETAPMTTNFEQLLDVGVELQDPDALDDLQLTAKLWEVIAALARFRVFLSETDHLDDRELYTLLWRDVLRHEIPDTTPEPDSAWQVGLLNGGGEHETQRYMKYYADEQERSDWIANFPDYQMPAHEDPPYDRDRRLPQAIDSSAPVSP